MKHKIPERLTALLLSLVMLVSLTTAAFADEPVSVTLDKSELALTLDGRAESHSDQRCGRRFRDMELR